MLGKNWIFLTEERYLVHNPLSIKRTKNHVFGVVQLLDALSDMFPSERKERKNMNRYAEVNKVVIERNIA